MRLLSRLLACALLFFAALPATAADALHIGGIPNINTLHLSDGTIVRLYGILPPQAATEKTKAWPLHAEALAFLQGVAAGKPITLRMAPTPQNRKGEVLAEAVMPDGESLQMKMVQAGLARVYTTTENPHIATTLYPLEQQARAAKRGIWALDAYAILTPDNASDHMNRFTIVEGKVLDVAMVEGTTYMNFGTDWKTDFTIVAGNALARRIGAEHLKGSKVRVRGWLHSQNGPMITLSHDEQLEILP